MQEATADVVFPIINYGLDLKERLDRGETPDLDTERAELKRLLNAPQARRLEDFNSDDSRLTITQAGSQTFFGIRYALVCWLDEIFIDSPWRDQYYPKALEPELYGIRLRAEKFWQQATLAETKRGSDALEVFFLCVMLGFRGDPTYLSPAQPGAESGTPEERLQRWATDMQNRIARTQGGDNPTPPELDPQTNVPPLHGRERFQKMVLIGGMLLLVLTLLTALFGVLLSGV